MFPGSDLVIGKLVEFAFAELSKLQEARTAGARIHAGSSEALRRHQEEIRGWASGVTAGGFPHSRRLNEVIIDLDLQFTPRKWQFGTSREGESKVSDLLNIDDHVAILGDPGAGKTTSLKQMIIALLEQCPRNYVPILVRLRDLQHKESLIERLQNVLGITVAWDEIKGVGSDEAETQRGRALFTIVSRFIDHIGGAVFLDGLDEVSPEQRSEVLNMFRQLTLASSRSRFIMTCRSGDFHYAIDKCYVVELRPLAIQQIEEFVRLWLRRAEDVDKFLLELMASPYRDAAVRPLTLAHLCTLYGKYHKIPDKPRSIYRLIVNLLLEEWDASRSVARTSRFDYFDTEAKREFLAHFAYKLTDSTKSASFTRTQLAKIYRIICEGYDLPLNEMRTVLTEIEAHSGLLVQTSYESFEFAHKSLQEYLAAEYIIKLPSLPRTPAMISYMPNEFALAVALSSHSTEYFAALVFGPLSHLSQDKDFLRTFVHRLLLEKPDFHPSPVLGVAVLYLTEVLTNIGRASDMGDVLLSLYSDTRIQKSIRFARSFYTLTSTNGPQVVYRWTKSPSPFLDYELPAEIRINTDVPRLRELLLDRDHEALDTSEDGA
jgi:hypothetical protein